MFFSGICIQKWNKYSYFLMQSLGCNICVSTKCLLNIRNYVNVFNVDTYLIILVINMLYILIMTIIIIIILHPHL